MNPLIRYWLFPGQLRRLPILGKAALALGFVLATAGVTLLILRQKPVSIGTGPLMIPAAVLFIGLPSILCIAGTFAGAGLVAGERQKQTWETILLTPLPVREVVALKLISRIALCLLVAAPAVAWLDAVLYQVVRANGFSFSGADVPAGIYRLRVAIYLAWTPLHVLAHLVPFVVLGMSVSARSRRVNEALLASSTILIAYAVLFWQVYTTLRVRHVLDSPSPGLPLELFRWPVLPFLSGEFSSAHSVLSLGWQNNLAADLIWTLVIPALLLIPTIAWSRLPQTSNKFRNSPHHP